jgi:hypothetical protein
LMRDLANPRGLVDGNSRGLVDENRF